MRSDIIIFTLDLDVKVDLIIQIATIKEARLPSQKLLYASRIPPPSRSVKKFIDSHMVAPSSISHELFCKGVSFLNNLCKCVPYSGTIEHRNYIVFPVIQRRLNL